MSKKVRANREFSDIFELAAYLNYYFSKNEDASISMNDIKKIVDNNPNFSMEEPTIGNTALRPVISDNEGHTLMLEMKPSFVVYEDDCEDEEPEDEDEETEEESDEDESEEEEKSDEEEETDEDGRKIDKNILEQFDWVKPGEEFLWHEPETDEEVPVVCDAVISKSGKVQSETTEITVHRRDENQEEKFNIFCDEIVLEDSDEESDEEIEDAEVVDESEESEESEDKDDE
jgi:hypothetical protein